MYYGVVIEGGSTVKAIARVLFVFTFSHPLGELGEFSKIMKTLGYIEDLGSSSV